MKIGLYHHRHHWRVWRVVSEDSRNLEIFLLFIFWINMAIVFIPSWLKWTLSFIFLRISTKTRKSFNFAVFNLFFLKNGTIFESRSTKFCSFVLYKTHWKASFAVSESRDPWFYFSPFLLIGCAHTIFTMVAYYHSTLRYTSFSSIWPDFTKAS